MHNRLESDMLCRCSRLPVAYLQALAGIVLHELSGDVATKQHIHVACRFHFRVALPFSVRCRCVPGCGCCVRNPGGSYDS